MEEFLSLLGIEHISASELNSRFDFISIFQKSSGVASFELEVMVIGIGTKPQLLDLHGMLLLFGFFLLLLLFIHEFTEVDHFTDRWFCIWSDLHQVEVERSCDLQGPVDTYDFMFLIGFDDTYLSGPDFSVDVGSV